ncbi:hypothetical protein E4U57_004994 [Claviceps arundinis]|uniref:BAH domain-containing protein n=1 Tax=Claviceps arundinis TaxID=1623583 RepID=A0A9P7SQC9_9HYPO|nr:hypothetical protein E4U57_004994 [Claviceps arundinis]KAG5968555.1 hypothetical protein E4U56_000304 [Claviceps arundinis]
MSPKSRKRSRPISEDNRADCPFSITIVAAHNHENRGHASKKRERDGHEHGTAAKSSKKELVQVSPFEPKGKFKSSQSMNLVYTVEPQKQWLDMTRYNSFVLNGFKYSHDEFVYVANDTTIELQKATAKNADGGATLQSTDYWVARILEVRASDELHVYARVYWMYSPDEIPAGTSDGRKTIAGRQPYHGQNELLASNHMDVINVVSVAMKATVHHWIESDDDEVQDALYWRQAFNCRTSQVSSVVLTCKCKTPANPDKTLVGCTNSKCGNWLHYECMMHDALMRVYEQLGIDKPYKSEKKEDPAVKLEHIHENDTEIKLPQQPLTPTETKEQEHTPSAMDFEGLKVDSDAVRPAKARKGTPKAPTQTPTPTPGPPSLPSQRNVKSTSTKKSRGKKGRNERPYEGLFEASLRMTEGPMAWDITDLRPNIQGGDRTWTERAACLVCKHLID